MVPYIDRQLAEGEKLSSITGHMLGIANGLPGARAFRRNLTEGAIRKGAGLPVVFDALRQLRLDEIAPIGVAAE
jgi:tRNA-dihydrouridine synthase A